MACRYTETGGDLARGPSGSGPGSGCQVGNAVSVKARINHCHHVGTYLTLTDTSQWTSVLLGQAATSQLVLSETIAYGTLIRGLPPPAHVNPLPRAFARPAAHVVPMCTTLLQLRTPTWMCASDSGGSAPSALQLARACLGPAGAAAVCPGGWRRTRAPAAPPC